MLEANLLDNVRFEVGVQLDAFKATASSQDPSRFAGLNFAKFIRGVDPPRAPAGSAGGGGGGSGADGSALGGAHGGASPTLAGSTAASAPAPFLPNAAIAESQTPDVSTVNEVSDASQRASAPTADDPAETPSVALGTAFRTVKPPPGADDDLSALDTVAQPAGNTAGMTLPLSFANDLKGWTIAESGGSDTGGGTVVADNGDAVMTEGDSFEVTLQRTITVPEGADSIRFSYEATFDTTTPEFINDAFEVALLGPDGRTLVHPYAKTRDAYFNVTEHLDPALGQAVTVENQTVTLDISRVFVGTEATLVFRLVNNDQDVKTTVRILGDPEPQELEPTVTKDNGEWAYRERGIWQGENLLERIDDTGGLVNSGWKGDYRYHESGDGNRRALWTLVVDPGQHQIMATWVNGPENATNATYRILDGRDEVGQVTVNQQLAPDDGPFDGATWESLGVYDFSNRVITVELLDNVDGIVIADGVIVVPAPEENQPPMATDNVYSTDEDTTLAGNVITDDTTSGVDFDPDGDPIAVATVNGSAGNVGIPVALPSGATLTIGPDGGFTYDPRGAFDFLPAGDSLEDTFTYTTTDGTHSSNLATVSIELTGLNDAPVVHDQSFMVDQNAPIGTVVGTVQASDPESDPLTFEILAGDPEGVFAMGTASGQITVADFEGLSPDTTFLLTVEVTDSGTPALSDTATVTIQVADLVPPRVVFRLETTNLAGDPVSTLAEGERFQLHGLVSDIQVPADGVFSAFLDIRVDDASLVSVVPGEVQTLTLSPSVTGGSFALSLGAETAAIAFDGRINRMIANVQTGLDEILGDGNSVVTHVPLFDTNQDLVNNNIFDIRFTGDLAAMDVDLLMADPTDLTTTDGGAATADVVESLPADISDPGTYRAAFSAGPCDPDFGQFTACYPHGRSAIDEPAEPGAPATERQFGEVGGFNGRSPLGGGEFSLFTVTLNADATGAVTFTGAPADILGHDVLVYRSDEPVRFEQIDYGGPVTVTIEPNDGSMVLAEDGRFATEVTHPFVLGEDATSVSFDVEAFFDETDQEPAIEDLFAVYLADAADPSRTLLDRGEPGTALFTMAGDQVEFRPGLVRYNGTTVAIDVTSLADVDEGLLRFQLLNSDADTGSQLVIRSITVAEDGAASPIFPPAAAAVSPGTAVDIDQLTASPDVQVLVQNVRFDSASGRYTAQLAAKNNGSALGRNMAIVLPGLPPGVTVANASGTTANGDPYLNLRGAIPQGGLGAGMTSAAVLLVIDNPQRTRFSIIPQVLTGGPNEAPVLDPIGPLSVMPGDTLRVPITARDPDGDRLVFSLVSDGPLPAHTFSGAGSLVFSPTPGDIGDYPFAVIASDGAIETRQDGELSVIADPDTTTRLSGVVLLTDESPVAGVDVELVTGETVLTSGVTSDQGTFQLEFTLPVEPAAVAALTLKIRANRLRDDLPFIAERVSLLLERDPFSGQHRNPFESHNNVIARPIYLPVLNVVDRVEIDPHGGADPQMVQVPLAEGGMATVEVARGSLEDQQGELYRGPLSITEVPGPRTPAALPENLFPDTVVTIQPGEMVFTTAAPLTLPNRVGWPDGTPMELWSINPDSGDFDSVGTGVVDGDVIRTMSGGILNSSWHFFTPPEPEPGNPEDDDRNQDESCDICEAVAPGTSDVELHSGAVRETHQLATYQSLGQTRGVVLHYNSQYADPRPIVHFGYGQNVPDDPDLLLVGQLTLSKGLGSSVSGGVAPSGQISHRVRGYQLGDYDFYHFWEVPSGGGSAKAAIQVDTNRLPTGVYRYGVNTGLWRATEDADSPGGIRFSGSSAAVQGELVLVSALDSPFGAGWQLAGLQRVSVQPNGKILLLDGNGMSLVFDPPDGAETDPYESPPGDFSELKKLPDNSFRRTMKDQTVYDFDVRGRLTSMTDRNSNQTTYAYDGTSLRLTVVTDPMGLQTRFQYTGDRVSKITDPVGRETLLQYDTEGNLIKITDPDVSSRIFEYDAGHRMTAEMDQRGHREQMHYAFAGRADFGIRKDGSRLEFAPVQTQMLLSPDATIDPFNAPSAFQPSNVASQHTDANGNVTTTVLDQAGQLIQSFDGNGPLHTVQRNEENLVELLKNGRGNSTFLTYDDVGNLRELTDDVVLVDGTGPLFPGEKLVVGRGRGPLHITSGDFNGDGVADLVTANIYTGGGLSVVLGRGDGTFQPEMRLVADEPGFVEIGDFNGDQISDLVIQSNFAGGGSVLLGRGNGKFDTVESNVPIGDGALVVSDFNWDGVDDLASTNSVNNEVTVLLGRGDGTFDEQPPVDVSDVPVSMAAGDFDGNGFDDLITANRDGDAVTVLLGIGNGTFNAQQTLNVGDGPESLVVGDFNGDRIDDVLVWNANSRDLSILLGRGDGMFDMQPSVPLEFRLIGTQDFNGDQIDDLLVKSGSFFVVPGRGDGTFDTEKATSVGIGGRGVVAGDFNLDGIADLAITFFQSIFSNDLVYVVLGREDGTFEIGHHTVVRDEPKSVAMADFNGDGFTDLATANSGSDDVSVLLSGGDGTFRDFKGPFAVGDSPGSITTGDFNGDGFTDLATANSGSDDVSVLLGNDDGTGKGDGTFTDVGQTFIVGSFPVSIATGDFNGDGITDLATANARSNDGSVLLGNDDGTGKGDGTFTDVGQTFIVGSRSIATGDFNGDGITDLAAPNYGSDDVSVLLGSGDGRFSPNRRFPAGELPAAVAVADFNGDRIDDVVTANEASGDVSVLLGVGRGRFSSERRFIVGGDSVLFGGNTGPDSVKTGDFNGDAIPDLVTTQRELNIVTVLLGQDGRGGTPSQPQTFTYEPTFSRLTQTTDELGHDTLFTIDPANGNQLSTTRVVGELDSAENGETDDLVTTFTYTTQGLVDTITDPLGRITDFDYNTIGLLDAITFALGTPDEATQRFEYDAAGNQSAFVDENGNRTEFVYDVMNRLRRITEPDPDGPSNPLESPVTQFDYDQAGNLTFTIDARDNVTENRYDKLNRLTTVIDADLKQTRLRYDKNGNLIRVTDPLENNTKNRYDARDRLVETIDPEGGLTRFHYDADNNLIRLTDPELNATTFAYDARDRLIREVDPTGSIIRFDYDPADNLRRKTDRNGHVTEFEYDDLDRLVNETWLSEDRQTVANTITYAYDGNSNLRNVSDTFSSLAFTYDARDRVDTVDNGGTPGAPRVVLDYEIDDVGNVRSVVDTIEGAAGAETFYLFDALNRTIDSVQFGPDVSEKRVKLTYNPLGQFAAIDRYSDLAATKLVAGSVYSYDNLNRLDLLTHSNTGGQIAFYDFTYDSASRITSIDDIDGLTTYTYDDTSQLTNARRQAGDVRGDEFYSYDANGNRTESHIHDRGYRTDKANRLISDGTFDYEYDDEGNMIRRTTSATGDYRTFEWDHRNRLIAVEDFQADDSPVQTVEFTYDALDRRISKAVDTDPLDAADAAIMHFVYDREDVILDFVDADGAAGADPPELDKRYLHGPAIDQVLAQEDSSSAVEWILTDHLGTVRDLVDNDGIVVNHILYNSFGNVIAQSDPLVATRYAFTGREEDVETELLYFRARYLDATVGRFLSSDPIGILGGLNTYIYVTNSPVSFVDPTGLERYVIIVGDPGLGTHNVGQNFDRAAQTRAAELRDQGHTVDIVRASTVTDIRNAMNSGTTIDGGVEFFGHGSWNAFYVGEQDAPGTNLDPSNVGTIGPGNFGPGVTGALNSCFAGSGGQESIAQMIADELGIPIAANDTSLSFSDRPGVPFPGRYPPENGPIYMVPAPGGQTTTFTPRPRTNNGGRSGQP